MRSRTHGAPLALGVVLALLTMGTSALLAMGTSGTAEAEAPLDGFERFVGPGGSFHFEGETARDGLAHLGSWFVPAGEAAGFHHVYTQPEAIAAYRETGVFPDGAVLLKELRGFSRANYTTGSDVASPSAPTQWFLMVKDAEGRNAENPLWREGWGWALFKADAPGKNVAKGFATDCQGCHLPARATDWVYVQGYPRLTADSAAEPGR